MQTEALRMDEFTKENLGGRFHQSTRDLRQKEKIRRATKAGEELNTTNGGQAA